MSQPQTRREGPTRKSGNWMMRNPSTGQFVSVAHGSSKAIAMPKEIGRALSIPTDALEVVIEALRAATARSRSDGTALQFTVEVKPNGKPRIVDTAAEPVGKPASETDAELEAALAAARARGRDRVAEILAGPDMLSAEDFAKHLGTTRATINTKRVGKQVLGLQGATRGYRYPDWQIGEDGGLSRLCLPCLQSWATVPGRSTASSCRSMASWAASLAPKRCAAGRTAKCSKRRRALRALLPECRPECRIIQRQPLRGSTSTSRPFLQGKSTSASFFHAFPIP
ncbi:hypothetical protein [Novosphingobium sp. ST904]|uniref:hypothetical protein n=1 Tax=Novosphingobium sp. ST904 TaxID=1684385 RepID=UPI0006C843D6|nr:hypothetical protein [Novosphingobium sp. ST904]